MSKILRQTPIKELFSLATHHNVHTQPKTRSYERLRLVNIIAPKPKPPSNNQTHLRLIQDFLQTNSDHDHHYSAQKFEDHLGVSNSNKGPLNDSSEFFETTCVVNEFMLSSVVKQCASARDISNGVQHHSLAIRTGFIANVYIGTSLITLYGRCAELDNAYKVFEEMPVRNEVSWSAIIALYSQESQFHVCMEIYRMMKNSDSKPNHYTYSSILSACTGTGALGQGRTTHSHIIQTGFDSNTHISNALISMYSKCGNLADAFYLFNTARRTDTVSWNSMIDGFAQHGLAPQAIELFEEMKRQRVKPDAITFLNVLSSCRHAGLVDQGRVYFDLMVEHGVEPRLDHCSCIIDLLGRAGKIKEALDFIQKMTIRPNAVIWGSLLSACRLRGNIWIGIKAAESKLSLVPGCVATHVQLANLYASGGYWDQAADIRKRMRDKGLKTKPGYSWIEIKDKVHEFAAEDKSDFRMTEILSIMDCLVVDMRNLGRVPELLGEMVD